MSRQIALALTVLALLVGATVAADRVVAAPTAPTAAFTEQADVDSGTWYCVPLVRKKEKASLTIAAVGDKPSRISVVQVGDGEARSDPDDTRELEPGSTFEVDVPGADPPPALVVRWRGGPVTTSWQVTSDDGGRLGASCANGPSPRWLLSGASTVIGSTTTLHLFNPFESDAVARVAFATPEGRVNLVSSENLSVPARAVVTVDITELQPEQPDLGVIVEVDAGRVIATGLQRFGQPDLPDIELEGAETTIDPSAPQGGAVLHASSTDATAAGFAYAATDERTTSWLTVLNPNNRAARLKVTASDEIAVDADAQEVVVGPESVERIELEGVSSAPNFGVTLESVNDVGFVANGFIARSGNRPAVSSYAGVAEPDAISVGATAPEGTDPQLALFNAGAEAASVAVTVSGSAPEAWKSLEIAPGEMELWAFADADVGDGGAPVVVTANQPVHATLRLGSGTELLTQPLVPANAWQGSSDALVPRHDRTLTTRPVDFPAQQDR